MKYLIIDDISDDQEEIEAKNEVEAMRKALEWARISIWRMDK